MTSVEGTGVALPTMPELLAASSVLRGAPSLARDAVAEEIALAEYCYYTTQTYVFESVGFQVLGDMAAQLRDFETVHAFAAQAVDEEMHARTYREVVRSLPLRIPEEPFDVQAAPIHAAFVATGSIEEKVIASYFVLESVAMGIFAARHRFFRSSSLVALDHRILEDEAQHQGFGVRLTADLVRHGRVRPSDVTEIARDAAAKISELLVPTPLFERFGVGDGRAERDRLLSQGFVDAQRATSQKAMLNSLRALRRSLSDRARGPHATAA